MKRPLFIISLALTGIVMILCLLFYENYDNPDYLEGKRISISGKVSRIQKVDAGVIISLNNISSKTDSVDLFPETSIKYWIRNPVVLCYFSDDYKETEFKIGQRFTIIGNYVNYKRATNPGEFDLKKYYFSKGILFSIRNCEAVEKEEGYSIIGHSLYEITKYVTKAFASSLDEESAGIMTAMFLGDRSGLSSEIKKEYSEAGISHILAISGLHISVLGAMFYFILDYCPIKPWMRVLCIAGILVCYGFVAGLGVSLIRAMVAFLLHKIAFLCGRSDDTITNLGVSAMVTVVLSPAMLLSSAFFLSYFAVLGLFLLPRCLLPYSFKAKHPVLYKILSGISIYFFTLPFVMNSYYSIPIYSIPLNLFILPFVPVLLFAGVGLVMVFGLKLNFLIVAFSFIIRSIFYTFRYLNGISLLLPHERVVTGARPLWKILVFYGILFLLCAVSFYMRKQIQNGLMQVEIWLKLYKKEKPEMLHKIRMRELGLNVITVLILVGLLIFLLLPEQTKVRIVLLDVGQGDGILIQSGDYCYVIDGGSVTRNDLANYVLEPALKYYGISQVDGWFVTHPDKDHISGLAEVLANSDIVVDIIYAPENLLEMTKEKISGEMNSNILPNNGKLLHSEGHNLSETKIEDIKFIGLHNDDILKDDNLCFYVLGKEYNPGVTGEDLNNQSLVLLMKYNKYSFLFMGDAGTPVETFLLEDDKSRKLIQNATVLKMGHHGSEVNTNSQEFLEYVNPQIALISCGKNNRYGHPGGGTLEILENLSKKGRLKKLYRTDLEGSVVIECEKRQINAYGGK